MAINELSTPYQRLNLIKAGAGAGKTYQIQKTLTDWICQGKVKADRILAVTFTIAAANEMQERIRLALIKKGLHEESKLLQQSSISTIHGFGLSLIERFAFEKGNSPRPKQLNEAEQRVLISRALNDVEEIEPILNHLPYWDYNLSKKGDDFISASEQLKNDLLSTIESLLNVGEKVQSDNFDTLIQKALESVRLTYGLGLANESTLNESLERALQSIKDKYTFEELSEQWGSNANTRSFVSAIFSATPEKIRTDWSLWTKLQTIDTAPKIFDKKTGEAKHEDTSLAFGLWDAADKLKIHPGPLNKSLDKISMLLTGAKKALGEYRAGKNASGLIDFNDMVTLSEELMREDKYISEMKSQYDCLIIDEFQDTNPLQFAMLWSFYKAGIPTLIVGDVKQSIMGFQGADKRLFESLLKQNSQDSSELTSNWRSTDKLMEFINVLGPKLFKDEYQTLTPRAQIESELEPVIVLNFPTSSWGIKKSKNKLGISSEGAFAIVPEIKALLESGKKITDKVTGLKRKIRPNDIAVLGKTHRDLNQFADVLRQSGLQPQIKEAGWFESMAIKELFYALSYIADPREQHALLYLKVLRYPDIAIQDILSEYLKKDKPIRFDYAEVDALNALSKKSKFNSLTQTVEQCIDALNLWDKHAVAGKSGYHDQQRANILKLLHLVEVFEHSEPYSLKAQGIFGKGLSSFLVWLKVNLKEFDQQPAVNNDNKDAIVLSTWFASKGLEWPVVVVLGLEKEVDVRFPNISIQYDVKSDVNTMLENAFTQIVTGFDDPNTKQKFTDWLIPFEQDTLKNLTYVVMTRAREQLILPWLETDKLNTMQDYLRRIDIKKYTHKTALYSDGIINKSADGEPTIKIGRVNLKPQSTPKSIESHISPSTLADNLNQEGLVDKLGEISLIGYGASVDLTYLNKYQADEIGSWVHQCYQVLVTKPEIIERLFEKLSAINAHPELKEQLIVQVKLLKLWVDQHWGALSYKTELPMLSTTESGQTMSGIVDLLIETSEGYWIVDHKTDINTDEKKFKHHLPQLLAYAKHIKLTKPILGVAINWVRLGKLTTLPLVGKF